MPQNKLQAQLSVRDGRAAMDLYTAAFEAVEVYCFGGDDELDEVVEQLAVRAPGGSDAAAGEVGGTDQAGLRA